MYGPRTIHRINNPKPAPDNVVKLPVSKPGQKPDLGYDPDYIALLHIDEILSYADPNMKPPEPGEIDPDALCDALFEYFAPMVDEQVEAALKPYAVVGHSNPLNHLPTTTPGYTKIVEYLKEFELRPRE